MATPLRVLIVEDSEDDAELLLRELRRGGFAPIFERVQTPATMQAALESKWEVVISDWGMPQFSAVHALRVLQETGIDLPFIIVSGTIDEEAAVSALRAGAHDFIAKGRLSRLIPAIEREMREVTVRAERRLIEQQLRHTQRIEAMGQLTGGIAHDFNNLLGVIVANGDELLEAVSGNPELAALANEILKSALHGADLTRRLLAFARQQPLTAETIDLNDRLVPIVAILRRTLGERITLTTDFSAGLWRTRIDPSQVEDAVLNLTLNARDAMPNGGKLRIETANAQLDGHYAALHSEVSPGNYVMLAITDTGTGMPEEVIDRAMEPFFTTKEPGKGTGLGLSMVYGFAKQSGGHISIYSEVAVGTTIRLYLPRAVEQDAGRHPVILSEEALPKGGEFILLVDDNAALRRATLRRLTGLGYHVQAAEDGPSALALIEAGGQIDLLFTDIGLPGGMNGRQLAAQARQQRPHLRVLFTTGYGNFGDDGDAPEAQYLLRKPYTGEELAKKLRAALTAEPAPLH